MTHSPDDAPRAASAHRLADRLIALRRQSGLSARAAAAMIGLARGELRSFELGRASVPSPTLRRLARLYGSSEEALLEERSGPGLRITADAVEVGSTVRPLPTAASDDEVLRQYLSAVYAMRGLDPGDDVALRDADLALLADVLGDTTHEIEARLIELVHCSRDEARAIRRALLRRRIAVPAAGLVMGVGSLSPTAAAAATTEADGGFVDQVLHTVAERVEDAVSGVQEEPTEAPPVADVPPPPVEDVPPPPVEDVPPPAAGDDTGDDTADDEGERGEDWAELIPPIVIENPDA